MNAVVIIDTETLVPQTVFAPGGVEGIISAVERDVRAVVCDISTKDGREAVKALAYKVARSKTALDDMGKELVAGIKAQAATIDADRRTIRDRFDALRDEVRNPLTAWEEAETSRVSAHESLLAAIISAPRNMLPGASAAEISAQMTHVADFSERDWEEFADRSIDAIADAIATLDRMLTEANQRERDAAELAELRQLKADRDEADRKAAEAAEAAATAAAAEALRIEREAHDAAAAAALRVRQAEQAERDQAAAATAAVEAERRRVAEQEAAATAAAEKRQANNRHRAKVHAKIMQGLSEVLTGDAAEASNLIDAIIAGKIPHVSITY